MAKELFIPINRRIGDLLTDVQMGRIGLPDLQRPFVWKDNKVRELLDSMLKGFPIGFVMLWESPADFENKRQIGSNDKAFSVPRDLIIDGQQRLTALLAAIKGVKIKDVNYRERNIRISYHPLKHEFAVWSQAYERSQEWISSISDVFAAKDNNTITKLRRAYIKQVNERRLRDGLTELTDDEEIRIEDSINDLLNLADYTLPTLEIKAAASEEDVADIFVRVNSGGQKLTEKNFIETLLSVYDNELYKQINDFCRDSRIAKERTSYNHIIEVDPVHIIRATVGLAFKRARLRYAYMLLRGKDLKTGKSSEETQTKNLYAFRNSLPLVMNLNLWHAFMNIVADAGYLKSTLISSDNAIIFSYMLYLIGKLEYKVESVRLNKLMRKWVFMATIRGYYTDSPESTVERQFADLRSVTTANDFVSFLENEISNNFTDDYFKYNLINDLETSSVTSPIWYGYVASLNVLNYPMLFSTTPTSKYFITGASGPKASIDIHHIFPKHYLATIGIEDDRDRNQIANYTYLDYSTNIDISDNPPATYVGSYRSRLGEESYKTACEQNALPENFETLAYRDFLIERRKLMAQTIRKAYDKLSE
ncbi:hypothetical protein HMPREF0663_11512 [Hoylesella oralis ATCC 33269]|uniref:GmrSD restriction endonucleases N-terminal domain-containing protein n=1 Tax=Hoylesella oralis ATCC 33269 TaxID=873533 RepID=E7RQR1_9BACT|nr:DUF262 domain-containing protein [Hoylesella oralis]EFZ36599.1 hypothetical protein HMPREF0663_11512 [Hoylesella oralis ATCC 33269]EPH17938.1 hypothetical protein HMPREF1475_00956 [Hoylesella oralis HGA0225]SHF98922.1 hypothetical protein SAMN05444288_2089 [Hoylesella oralis]